MQKMAGRHVAKQHFKFYGKGKEVKIPENIVA